jgi:hypothetical protein
MPNNITNVLTIESVSPERVNEIIAAIRCDDARFKSIDFEKIVPMPDTVYQGDLGTEERKIYGKNNWRDWSVENWGSKWNAYGLDIGPYHDDYNQIEFTTAWSSVHPIIQKLSQMFPDAVFRYAWADDDLGMNVGEMVWANGKSIEWDIPIGGSKEAFEMAAEIKCTDLSDYDLFYSETTGTYECVEPDEDEDEDETEDMGIGGLT